VFGKMGEVGPLVGIGLVVVEFLGAVRVAGVAVALRADGMVVMVMGGEGGLFPLGLGIFQQWNETGSIDVVSF
jgi:hypothetical protein